ncbi:MAG TPA: hypothetical protein VNF47_00400 [Streptosporangiaceae bacterium]|nr:hypothetical protein [Streptosporangiaceae bacterium]
MNGSGMPLRSRLRRIFARRLDPVPAKFVARLPSEIPEAQFQAVIEATWPPGTDACQSMRSLADRLLNVARTAAKKYSVLDRDKAWAGIERALLSEAGIRQSGLITLRVADVRVRPDDRSLAEKQRSLRHEVALARARAENLRVLLANPTTACLWWLENSPDKLEKLADNDMSGIFDKVAAIFGESAESPPADPIAELIRLFLKDLDGQFRELLIEQLGRVFKGYERDDLAASLDDC